MVSIRDDDQNYITADGKLGDVSFNVNELFGDETEVPVAGLTLILTLLPTSFTPDADFSLFLPLALSGGHRPLVRLQVRKPRRKTPSHPAVRTG